jgi:Peptidase A4 family
VSVGRSDGVGGVLRMARWMTCAVVVAAVLTATAGAGARATAGAVPARNVTAAAGALQVGPMIPAPSHKGITAPAADPVAQSSNWSGYAATSSAKFTSVQGSFVQPSIVCSGQADQVMAAWVGLDGFRDKTVEQDGTFAACAGPHDKTAQYYAWYEMYPAGSVSVFSVNPGDVIQAAVAYADGAFTLSIADTTSDQSRSVVDGCKSCRRASAEWIVERPAMCVPKKGCFLTELPDFTLASLSTDSAGTDTTPAGTISSFTNTPIDMIQPEATSNQLLDQVNPLDATGDSFSVTWERSGKKTPFT